MNIATLHEERRMKRSWRTFLAIISWKTNAHPIMWYETVRTYCYMALVRSTYSWMCIYERMCVSTVVLTHIRLFMWSDQITQPALNVSIKMSVSQLHFLWEIYISFHCLHSGLFWFLVMALNIDRHDMIWYDMICDMIWCDVMWYDMIWYDMIWYDMIFVRRFNWNWILEPSADDSIYMK